MSPPGHGHLLTRTRPLLAAAVLAVTFAACSGGDGSGKGESLERGTPVVLISVDTLRSDRLPVYGYGGIETPAIDALRRDSVLFERAFTHINQTLPSHASIFTGQLPPEHGVRDNIGYELSEEATTLAEVLSQRGYATGGFVSSFVLRADTGIGQGFDHWDDQVAMDSRQGLGGLQRDGFATLEPTTAWLDRQVTDDPERPWFLFFHIYDPHAPYEPVEPFRSRYQDPYDAEVAESDAIVGGLLDHLRQRGLYDEALIVFLSDHGEGLMDHGEMDHLVFLYREVIQIPLLVKLPKSRFGGATVIEPAQSSDVFWTVLDLLGIDPPGDRPPANDSTAPRTLIDLARAAPGPDPQLGERDLFAESLYPRIHLGWSDLSSIVRWPWHLIDGPDPELYDLASDPAETRNVLRDQRREYRALKATLEGIDRTLQSAEEIDEETAARLASLGYVSGGGPAGEGPLPDPKSLVHLLEMLGQASAAFDSGRRPEAERIYRQILAEAPTMVLAHQQLGRTLRADGRLEEALEPLRQALELSGGSAAIAVSVGEVLLQLGETAEAKEHALIALSGGHAQADHLLARVALVEGDLDEATTRLRAALQARGDRVAPLVTQVTVLVRQERWEDALAIADEALAAFGDRSDRDVLAGLHLQCGNALANLGRGDEAEAAFRREIELAPQTLNAHSNLAYLLVLRGQAGEAIAVLQRMVEDLDSPRAHLHAARTLAALGDRRSGEGLLAQARRRWPREELLQDADLSQIEPPSFGAGGD
ncbi:MAG: hypothetical protein DWQ36_10475 [Acidobacteria bacterium]|nr:MAG: hypothetical protein DWQ36_10475 [Acidobacteriota bacterium]